MKFADEVIEFCKDQKYQREGAATTKEFSEVAFRLYGEFFLEKLTLEQIVSVTNHILYARVRPA